MFQYFPTNYVWNLSINLAIEMGAKMGELDEICAPLVDLSKGGENEGTLQFMQRFSDMGDKLVALAREDESHGRLLSAGEKLKRAATYFITCERMQEPGAASRTALYKKFQDTFARGIKLARDNCELVTIPYVDSFLTGLYVRAENPSGPVPCMVVVNGLDVTKEILYSMQWASAMARRGISCLVLDQPGTGDALRQRNLTAIHESEQWAGAAVDWLQSRGEVDAERIGMTGISLAGYYVPRAVAFEPRFAMGIACGAIYDWGEINRRRQSREGDRPVPHYWEHAQWVWNARNIDELMEKAAKVAIGGFLDRIKVPFLITHGANDRQIPLAQAQATFDGLVNSPLRELKVFSAIGTGIEHCHADNFTLARDFMADWAAEVFKTRTS